MDSALMGLVVRISAEATQYQSAMRGAVSTAQSTAAAVASAGTRIEGLGRSLQGFGTAVSGALSVAAGGVASLAAGGRLKEAFDLFSGHEDTEIRLEAAVRATGGAVEQTMAAYREYAAAVAATTTTGKDEVLNLLKTATTFRATGDAAVAASRDALALAAATGTSAETVIRLSASMAQGDVARAQHMARVLPQLRFVKDQAEFVREYNKLVEVGLDTQGRLANTASGQLAQLNNAWRGILKQVGAVVAEGLKPLVGLAREAVAWFGGLSKETREAVVVLGGVALAVGGITAAVATAGIVFNLAFGGSPLLLGLVAVALVAAAGGAVGLVRDLGGVGPTFAAIKKAAEDAWAWLAPVRAGVASLASEVAAQAAKIWGAVKAGAAGLFGGLSGADVRSGLAGGLAAAEQVVRNFGATAAAVWADFRALAGAAAGAVVPVVEWLSRGAGWVRQLAYDNRGLVVTLVAAYGAFRLVQGGIALTAALAGALRLEQALSAAAWVGWSVAVGVARGATLLWQASLAAAGGVLWAVKTATEIVTALVTGVWTAGFLGAAAAEGIATLATAGLTAAVAALDVALAPATLIAAGLFVGVLAAAFVGVTGAVYGTLAAATTLYDTLTALPTAAGPVAVVVGLFGEWSGMIQDVVAAAGKDLPKAWELAKIGAFIAVEESYALWPPLWAFVKAGFAVVADAMTKNFNLAFQEVADTALARMQQVFDVTAHYDIKSGQWHGVVVDAMEARIAEGHKKTLAQMEANTKEAQAALAAAAGDFKPDFDTWTIQQYRREFEKLKTEIAKEPDPAAGHADWLDEFLKNWKAKWGDAGQKHGDAYGDRLAKGVQAALPKLDAALVGTAEDIALLAQYRAALHAVASAHAGAGAAPAAAAGLFDEFGGDFGGAGLPVVAVNPALPGGGQPGEAVPLLKQIRDAVVATARKPGVDVQVGMGIA